MTKEVINCRLKRVPPFKLIQRLMDLQRQGIASEVIINHREGEDGRLFSEIQIVTVSENKQRITDFIKSSGL